MVLTTAFYVLTCSALYCAIDFTTGEAIPSSWVVSELHSLVAVPHSQYTCSLNTVWRGCGLAMD